MIKKYYKIILLSGIAAILIILPLFWFYYQAPKNLEVSFLDVGQGDSILIQTPSGQNILIDGGPDKKVLKRLAQELPWWEKKIDLMILTHPHDDHVAGLVEVLKKYQVQNILYTAVDYDSPYYSAWLDLIKDKKIKTIIVDRPQAINFSSDSSLKIIYPRQSFAGVAFEDPNNSSIVSQLVYGQIKFLLTGDAEVEVEKEILATQDNIESEVLKVGHHGSETASSEEFLEKVKPKIAIIQVGKDNDFGHPNLRIIKRLERLAAEIFRTDIEGTIKLLSDGDSVWEEKD